MRQRNIGWRLDYVLASEALAARATACPVQADVGTSDHAPVMATLRAEPDGRIARKLVVHSVTADLRV